MGRKSTFTKALDEEICNRISEGEPLRQICRDGHMPEWRTVYDWIKVNSEFAASIAHARDAGFDAIAEDTIAMVDEAPERTATQHGDRVDAGHVQWQKNRVEQRLKLLAKWSPKYRETANVNLKGTLTLTDMTEDDIRAELAALVGVDAAARLTGEEPVADDCSDLV
jgi:hypothetical protein